MNYQVLARKWRPTKFTEVVGQDHVVQSLVNALQHDRLHHAYLFTGTRGVGKTTLARILAKAINCENPVSFNPCGECSVCQAVDQGRFIDLIEVDAASRTKVEDTRDLLDNVQYAPNSARYKVYLIDEVHMLSGHSFNALLKTLEEPPPHVKFLLATTDPQKIPVTVLSRCLQFNLKRLSPVQIFEQMQSILRAETIPAETEALKLIAQAADGSMRDALSILDQAIVYGSGNIASSEVNTMLGTVAQKSVEGLLCALADGNGNLILELVEQIANSQADFAVILEQILHVLHHIALAQHIPDAIDYEFNAESIVALAKRLVPEEVQLYYQMALVGQKDLELAPDSRMGFEMLMLRMLTFRPVNLRTEKIHSSPADTHTPVVEVKPVAANQIVKEDQAIEITELKVKNYTLTPNYADEVNWVDMIAHMRLGSITRELANNCVLVQIDDDQCILLLDASHQHLLSPVRQQKLQGALQSYAQKPIKLIINIGAVESDTPAAQRVKQDEDRQQAAVDAINADANIQALQEHFAAKIMPGSIEPV